MRNLLTVFILMLFSLSAIGEGAVVTANMTSSHEQQSNLPPLYSEGRDDFVAPSIVVDSPDTPLFVGVKFDGDLGFRTGVKSSYGLSAIIDVRKISSKVFETVYHEHTYKDYVTGEWVTVVSAGQQPHYDDIIVLGYTIEYQINSVVFGFSKAKGDGTFGEIENTDYYIGYRVQL